MACRLDNCRVALDDTALDRYRRGEIGLSLVLVAGLGFGAMSDVEQIQLSVQEIEVILAELRDKPPVRRVTISRFRDVLTVDWQVETGPHQPARPEQIVVYRNQKVGETTGGQSRR